MTDKNPDCPLILAGVMAGKSGYSACRRSGCAWWDHELCMCCMAAANSIKARQTMMREGDFLKTPTDCRIAVPSLPLYDQEETFPDCTVQILRNSITGETSIGWWENKHEQ